MELDGIHMIFAMRRSYKYLHGYTSIHLIISECCCSISCCNCTWTSQRLLSSGTITIIWHLYFLDLYFSPAFYNMIIDGILDLYIFMYNSIFPPKKPGNIKKKSPFFSKKKQNSIFLLVGGFSPSHLKKCASLKMGFGSSCPKFSGWKCRCHHLT